MLNPAQGGFEREPSSSASASPSTLVVWVAFLCSEDGGWDERTDIYILTVLGGYRGHLRPLMGHAFGLNTKMSGQKIQ